MRSAGEERRDLIVLVANSQQKQTVATFLIERWQPLSIRQSSIDVDSGIFAHPTSDPGVFREAGRFLSTFAQQCEHGLMLLDAEWDGNPSSTDKIEGKI